MPASPTLARRRLPLRFSLRMLLIAVTAFAIGFPVWYRWPYTEVEVHYRERNGQPDKSQPWGRTVTSWQRQWGGGRLKHGTTTTYFAASKRKHQVEFRNGERERRLEYADDGYLQHLVEYDDDQRRRETRYLADGSIRQTTELWNDQLHGQVQQHLPDGRVMFFRFNRGRVTHQNGEPIVSPLFSKLANGRVDPQVALQLANSSTPPGGDTPQEQLEWLGRERNIPVVADGSATKTWSAPRLIYADMELASAFVIHALAENCECDYRDGCIWVLPRFSGEDWRDPTGVVEIRPPAGSPLAAAWSKPVRAWGSQGRLDERLSAIADRLAIAIDTSRVEPTEGNPHGYLVTTDIAFLPFRHALTLLLFHTRCRCDLRGETLVILPPEGK